MIIVASWQILKQFSERVIWRKTRACLVMEVSAGWDAQCAPSVIYHFTAHAPYDCDHCPAKACRVRGRRKCSVWRIRCARKWLVRYHEISIVYCSAVTARIVTGSGRACRKWRPPASHNAACSCENRNYSPAPLLFSLHMFSVLEGWECCGVRTMYLPCSGTCYFLAACPFSWFTYRTVIKSSVGVNYV